jgi:hypothetical protein
MGLVWRRRVSMEFGEDKHKIDWRSGPDAAPRDPQPSNSWHRLTNHRWLFEVPVF